MLVTVSGIVGSGKTTVSRQVVDLLAARGLNAASLRFQSLPCFAMLRSSSRRNTGSEGGGPRADREDVRWTGYKKKRLSAAATGVYIARVTAFRLYRLSWRTNDWYVLNRYFYDLFVHYQLTTARERFYFALLRAIVPTPDLALLTTARGDTIAARRPNYSSEYLSAVTDSYARLPSEFPHLIHIRTDTGESARETVAQLVADHTRSAR